MRYWTRLAPVFACVLTAAAFLAAHGAVRAEQPAENTSKPVIALDRPLTFSYGSWEKKAAIEKKGKT